QEDSILMKVYPNPSNGNFWLYFEDNSYSANYALLKISDLSGQVHYMERISLADDFFSKEVYLPLSGILQSGSYSLMVIIDPKSSARRLLIQQ
ncbi:MAG: T9SS type A sorting domain-containing protein, partial [Bacteroidales bacterium]|nr:T9SS type A sorting domain-containing protein [Bacteroidales bacterium]